jgi:hypothetical protein
MVVGTLYVELFIADGLTLKDKRRVVKSLLDRMRSRFSVSAAEVGRLDAKQHAALGAACVSNSTAHASQVLDALIRFIESEPRARVIECQTEYL